MPINRIQLKHNGGQIMISTKIQDAINEQINAELWSAYLYLSMSAYLEEENLPGFANWMKVQYQEETSHAMKFFDYLTERGGRVLLKPIKEVPTEWNGIIEVFEETLKHERLVSGLINELVNTAIEEKDHATNNFLQWFVAEQVEEEATAEDILNKLKMLEGKGPGLFMMDKDFAGRSFVDETQA